MSMYPKNMFFRAESVTEGHPDKFCDQVSDTVLDECLSQDPLARVACECYVTMNSIETGQLSDEALSKFVRQVFPLSPHGIIDHLKLRQPVYLKTAVYGHFGRPEFTWEGMEAMEELLAKAKYL